MAKQDVRIRVTFNNWNDAFISEEKYVEPRAREVASLIADQLPENAYVEVFEEYPLCDVTAGRRK